MSGLTLQELTGAQLTAMADGLMAANQYGLARQLYARVTPSDPDVANVIYGKSGLAGTPRPYTGAMMKIYEVLDGKSRSIFVGDSLATWNKHLHFLEDARFREIAERHADLLPIPNWHWNLSTVLWAVQETLGLPGDLVELGVFKGHTTLFTAEYVDFAATDKTWWLYDTFDGIPDDQVDPGWEEVNIGAYRGTFSFEEVRDRFAHIPNIRVIKGRVPEILDADAPDRIAFLHIDLNNATAEIAALNRLYERIVPGGIIIFDDFGWTNSSAQRVAETAWFAERGRQVLTLPTGQGLLVKR